MATRATTVPTLGSTEWSTRSRSTVTSWSLELHDGVVGPHPGLVGGRDHDHQLVVRFARHRVPHSVGPGPYRRRVADTLPGLGDLSDDEPDDPDETSTRLETQSGLGRGLGRHHPDPRRPRRAAPAPKRRRPSPRWGRPPSSAAPTSDEPTARRRRSGADASRQPVAEPAPVRPAEPAPSRRAGPRPAPRPPCASCGTTWSGRCSTAWPTRWPSTSAPTSTQGPGEEPHLFLQSPSLDAIGPARAYALFDGLRVDLEAGRSDAEFAAAGFQGVTRGDRSATAPAASGPWPGPRTSPAPEREVATRFCRSFGRAVHQLDGAAAPATTIATPAPGARPTGPATRCWPRSRSASATRSAPATAGPTPGSRPSPGPCWSPPAAT